MAKGVFFVALRRKDEFFTGLRVVTDPADLKKSKKDPKAAQPSTKEENKKPEMAPSVFKGVIDDYIRSMDAYRKFMPMIASVAPTISYQVTSVEIQKFAQAKGRLREDLKGADYVVYELGLDAYPEFQIQRRKVRATRGGAKHLPEVMLIGLISIYDIYFSALLRAAAGKEAKVFLSDDKTIRLSELNQFGSMDEAKESIIQRELDSILRSSVTDQRDWCQKQFKFDPGLKSYLPHWPEFVEIVERRNLFAHTGGVVSAQYIQNCTKAGVEVKSKLSERIDVDGKYFSRAVDVVCETGMKLGHVFWRTVSKEETSAADNALNSFCFDLILEQNYALAADLLKFGVDAKKRPSSEELRRMMIVNYANCLRLMDKQSEADALLDKEDWSACSANFRVSVAAVKNDVKKVIEVMKAIGPKGDVSADEYRSWPVFSRLQGDKEFQDAFKAIFNQPLIRFDVVSPAEEIKAAATEVSKTGKKAAVKKKVTKARKRMVH